MGGGGEKAPSVGPRLGIRNPNTLPGSSRSAESEEDNERNTKRWRPIIAWATKPGGKYV